MATADWNKKTSDVPEGARRQWRADRALRPPMRSPERPEPSRVVQRQFWRLIATGITSAEAALKVGVSVPVGTRWFRHAGGMPPIALAESTRRYLSFEEREEIALLRAKQVGVREIARRIRRDPGRLRQYVPKGTDLSRWSAEDLEAVALALNNRPRKSLDWKTPAEVFEEQLRSLSQPDVATYRLNPRKVWPSRVLRALCR